MFAEQGMDAPARYVRNKYGNVLDLVWVQSAVVQRLPHTLDGPRVIDPALDLDEQPPAGVIEVTRSLPVGPLPVEGVTALDVRIRLQVEVLQLRLLGR